jgi:hypothetical protein
MDPFDVTTAYTPIPGSVHRGEGILAVGPPNIVTNALSALVVSAFVVCHQHDSLRADAGPGS